ncbi:N-acetyltransferase [Novipirellula artificiosorum]|nr:N-acetyltransferase [Novipirellula artificiosorum]
MNERARLEGPLTCDGVASRRDQKEFLQVEREVNRGNPHWVPPIWSERRKIVGFKHHPFYDDADRQAFIARRGSRPVGRILAIVNHGHNRRYEEQRGFVGFFECFDDREAAAMLFDHAFDWLRQQGMTDVRGPVHPSLNYEVGLLVDGFDSPPTFLIPYNPEYYEKLYQESGFEKTQDLFSYEAHIDIIKDLDPKLKFVIDEATRRFKVNCRPLDRKHFKKDVRTFLEIYNRSLEKTWGYVPMSEAEIAEQSAGLKHLIVPELTSIAEIDGEPVGAGFGLLDYNQIISKIDGRLFPFGWLRLLTGKRKIDRLRLISTNVLPKYQKWGIGLVTLSRILPDAVDFGIQVGEFSWVLESNKLSRGTIERGGATRVKTHRLYDRSLD